jgi:hypothetical protein
MNPALATRVAASVAGHRNQRSASHAAARWTSWVRFGIIAGVAWLAISIVVSVRRDRAELAHTRATLLAQWQTHSESLAPKDKKFIERVERAIAGLRTTDSSGMVADELPTPGALASTLGRPAVYLRTSLATLDGSPSSIARAAADSGKDTLLLCLIEPPTTLEEKLLLAKARAAMAGGTAQLEHTPNVLRLHDAEVGLPMLLDPWRERIQSAKDGRTLQRLERDFRHAPINAAKRAVRSEVLIAVLDEPNDKGSVTELDGEAPHGIRLAIIELDSGRALLRVRRHVDPRWISSHRRPQYARELDGCRFALDVHSAVQHSLQQ